MGLIVYPRSLACLQLRGDGTAVRSDRLLGECTHCEWMAGTGGCVLRMALGLACGWEWAPK